MAQLNDLPEECLLAVFDWLSPKQLIQMQRVNKRMSRLAEEKIRTKVKVMNLWARETAVSECSRHLGAVNTQQLDVLDVDVWSLLSRPLNDKHVWELSIEARFFRVLAMCRNVKSVDFGNYQFTESDLLLEVVHRCPRIECIKMSNFIGEEDEWSQALELVGHQLVHFRKRQFNAIPNVGLLELVASKCDNIRQLDWFTLFGLPMNSDLMRVFRLLPKNCWVTFHGEVEIEDFDDIFDELDIAWLNWYLLGQRIERLSSLRVRSLFGHFDPGNGVDFDGLKKLDVSKTRQEYSQMIINCLSASRFPVLEEFGFSVNAGLGEDDYDRLFQRMASVKKLTLKCDLELVKKQGNVVRLPRSAIHRLENLENIYLDVWHVSDNWQTDNIFQQLEEYVDGIKTLKKLTVKGKDSFLELIKNKLKKFDVSESEQSRKFYVIYFNF